MINARVWMLVSLLVLGCGRSRPARSHPLKPGDTPLNEPSALATETVDASPEEPKRSSRVVVLGRCHSVEEPGFIIATYIFRFDVVEVLEGSFDAAEVVFLLTPERDGSHLFQILELEMPSIGAKEIIVRDERLVRLTLKIADPHSREARGGANCHLVETPVLHIPQTDSETVSFALPTWAEAKIVGPTVSPDGKIVAFFAGVRGLDPNRRRTRLVTLNIETGRPTFYDEPRGMGPETWPGASWSPDSSKLAFTFIEGSPDNPETLGFNTWVLSLKSRSMKRAFRLDYWITQFPRFSPDGNRLLVYVSRGNVAVVDLLTGKHSFLFPEIQIDDGPAGVYRTGYGWSADGRSAYVSRGYMGGDDPGIWVVDIQSGQRKLLSDSHRQRALYPAPSGQYLAFIEAGEDADTNILRVMSIADRSIHTISRQVSRFFVDWSGPTNRLAFCEKGKIVLWSASHDETVTVWSGDGQPYSPSWVGATDSLIFVLGSRELWLLDVASGESRRIASAASILKLQPKAWE